MQQWEYAEFLWGGPDRGAPRVVRFSNGETWDRIGSGQFVGTLAALGDAGWELVSSQFETFLGDGGLRAMLFKRPKR